MEPDRRVLPADSPHERECFRPGQSLEVTVEEAPEAHGALEENPLTAFISGELESLLSDLADRKLRHEATTQEPDRLLIRFAPQVR